LASKLSYFTSPLVGEVGARSVPGEGLAPQAPRVNPVLALRSCEQELDSGPPLRAARNDGFFAVPD